MEEPLQYSDIPRYGLAKTAILFRFIALTKDFKPVNTLSFASRNFKIYGIYKNIKNITYMNCPDDVLKAANLTEQKVNEAISTLMNLKKGIKKTKYTLLICPRCKYMLTNHISKPAISAYYSNCPICGEHTRLTTIRKDYKPK